MLMYTVFVKLGAVLWLHPQHSFKVQEKDCFMFKYINDLFSEEEQKMLVPNNGREDRAQNKSQA